MEKTVQFHLEDFEGPLDLLLTLVRKNKKSIQEIEILTLIDQYLEVVGQPGPDADALDANSEFISMAAWLVQMKSASLLPRSEEAERMREELTGLLVEYEACKEIAGRLREMSQGIFMVARRPLEIELATTYRGSHQLSELTAAFSGMMGRSNARRLPKQEQFDEIVTAPQVSVAGRVIHLLRGLKSGFITRLAHSFAACRSRGETVATFLALLELIRGGRVAIADNEEMQVLDHSVRQKVKKHREEGYIADGT